MKSVIAPTFAPLSFRLSKTKPFTFFSKSHLFNYPSILLKPKFLHTTISPKPPIHAHQSRALQTDASQKSHGEIHLIVGPMFAGKTTTLLRRVQAETQNGRSVAIVKSSKDSRYGLDSIVTHDGVKYPCYPLTHLSSFRQIIGIDAYNQLDVIGIDEAQFFEDLHGFCQEAADHDGKTVIVAGLDGDYLRRSFGSVLEIIPLADSVTKLTARCEVCGKHASFTLRKTEEAQRDVIGGSEVYMPVCRHHYVGGRQVVRETARIVSESQKDSLRIF